MSNEKDSLKFSYFVPGDFSIDSRWTALNGKIAVTFVCKNITEISFEEMGWIRFYSIQNKEEKSRAISM